MALPVIAIIGRPNVGKSTLFNRLVGERYAITSPVAGTTRDRVYYETELGTYRCILVDTAGMEFGKKTNIEADMQAQARIAIEEAHLILFVIDGTEPLTSSDLDCAKLLRKSKRPILLIAHKADNQKMEQHIDQIYGLGLGEPLRISSIHNLGIHELHETVDKIFKKLKWKKERPKKKDETRIAIVGKPNVGKSSLVNALLGKDRLIVSDVPGTTIDSTDTPFKYESKGYILIDTAGLRRRGKVGQGVEKYSVLRSLAAISRSDVTCLVLDWSSGIANQDLHVSQYILDAGKGLIIVVNKTDLMDDAVEQKKKFLAKLQYRMSYAPWAPVIFTSALTKKSVFQLPELSSNIVEERERKLPPELFNTFIRTTAMAHLPTRSGKHVVITKAVQRRSSPPTFTIYTNHPDLIHFSYKRFLENEIRRKFGFFGTSIRLEFEKDER